MACNAGDAERRKPTSDSLLHIVENQVHERVVSLQCALDYSPLSARAHLGRQERQNLPSRPPLNLTVICLSMYFPRSKMFSFFGLSFSWCCCPPAPPPRPP